MDPEMSHKNYNVCVTHTKYILQEKWSKDIFDEWTLRCHCHTLEIYFCTGMALEYILGQDIFFWSVGVSGVPVSAKNLGFCVSGSKSTFPNMEMCAFSNDRVHGAFPYMEICDKIRKK
jgi:hypothetical protein